MSFLPAEVIKKKRDNNPLSELEISEFIVGYTKGQIPDYQMSALLMAIFLRGMNSDETLALTKVMLDSGEKISFPPGKIYVDKHSTGGVGDKTSLILGPIVAAAGVPVPMISGRGLGHTGGTLDKLESIPGFSTQLSLGQFKRQIENANLCFIGQTKEICPADKKIYALRDVTATVESLPLICASIMSKKLAEGIDALVLDVKFGSGAFMKTLSQAEALAQGLMDIARGYKKKVAALLTSMDQPLGRFAGNALEVFECLEILEGKSYFGPNGSDLYAETRELSVELAAQMIWISGREASLSKSLELATNILVSGKALEKFIEIVELQGGKTQGIPKPIFKKEIYSSEVGFLQTVNTEGLGIAGILIGAGRGKIEDTIDPTAGIEFHIKIGEKVTTSAPMLTLWGNNKEKLDQASVDILKLFEIGNHPPGRLPLIAKILN